MKKVLYTITIVLLLAVFAFSAFQVVNYLVESKEQAAKFDELSQIKQNAINAAAAKPADKPQASEETSGEKAPDAPTEETEVQMLPQYAALYEMNSDIVGWITIPNTRVDYPVMQTPDMANYYLERNFEGNYSARGCLYAREECDINEPSDNITIYGHNMLDGSMLAALHDYIDKKTWDQNNLIFFDTLYEYHVYEIFAVFKTTASLGKGFSYHQLIDAASEEEFDEYIATCKIVFAIYSNEHWITIFIYDWFAVFVNF